MYHVKLFVVSAEVIGDPEFTVSYMGELRLRLDISPNYKMQVPSDSNGSAESCVTDSGSERISISLTHRNSS